MPRLCLLALLALFGLAPSVLFAQNADDAQKIDFFESRIRPILVDHCYPCHSGRSDPIEGGLRVDFGPGMMEGGDSGPAIIPGNVDDSLLIQALRYDGFEMPPDEQLDEKVIRDFEHWIATGAVDPRSEPPSESQLGVIDYVEAAKFWAFQPPRRSTPPDVAGSEWVRSDIDRFVLAQLESEDLSPNKIADRNVLIRRAYLDLIGIPPTPEQVASFLNDDSDDAFAAVVNQLLESPHYGERWGRRWLDVARYGEDQAHTFKARKYPRGYLYRDWVIDSFNNDMPYDEFLRWQIAGDLIDEPNRNERLAALGLFALGPVYYAENVEKKRAEADEWDDRIDTLTRGTLGLTVSCARCHDHKYDPISTEDYYALAGIFAGTQYQERPIVPDEVVAQRRLADDAVAQQQLRIDEYLATESRELRVLLVDQIPEYFVATWLFQNRRKTQNNQDKAAKAIAQQTELSQELIKRWSNYLSKESPRSDVENELLGAWFTFIDENESEEDLSENEELEAKAHEIGERFQEVIRTRLPKRDKLFAAFGNNVAFASEEDLTVVRPGVIPLGNLFDDSPNVALESALSSDKFSAVATADSLGVERVAQGWGGETEIAPGIRFDFRKLGSTSDRHSSIVNDAWRSGNAIRTRGSKFSSNQRVEQGIGMHANALLTFDLDEIRKAGVIPSGQRLRFKVDRAGINDDTIGSQGSTFLAVLISRPHRDEAVTDAILGAYVNGKSVDVDTNDFTYYPSGEVGSPLLADGQFVAFDLQIPADAKYLTLVATAAGEPDDNPISSDHAVFSGARLEFDPLPVDDIVASESGAPVDVEAELTERDLADAVLLSRMFYDEGLLAVPAADAEPFLDESQQLQLQEIRSVFNELKKEAESIEVLNAHSLADASGRDLPIYLRGNPEDLGDVAERSMPRIFTSGERTAFATSGSGRLELADAIASENNPLTARVIVNRVWAGHFGNGIVKTTSNFGQLGGRPSHPELLDWLTIRFIENGWSLKQLHRDIMMSSTYQQSSDFRSDCHERDPDNRMLWRMNRRRLEVEPWRDSMLAVSGELDVTLGGPSIDLNKGDNRRRTVYGFVSRHRLNELLRLFDFPDPNITAADRSVTTVPLQQLLVLNSDFMMQRARGLAKRIDQFEATDDEKAAFAYRLVFGREITEAESELVSKFLAAKPNEEDRLTTWEQLALALLGSNEFMFVD